MLSVKIIVIINDKPTVCVGDLCPVNRILLFAENERNIHSAQIICVKLRRVQVRLGYYFFRYKSELSLIEI